MFNNVKWHRGIRAQLFLGFGALVLIVILFYTKLTFLFIEITEDLVAEFALEQALAEADSPETPTLPLEAIQQQTLIITQLSDNDKRLVLTPSMHDKELFHFEYQHIEGYARSIDAGTSKWALLNTQKILSLANFNSIFSLFLSSIALGIVSLAVLCTWFIASRLSAPLRNLTRLVSSQRPGESCHMEESTRQDEIGQLAVAFEDTYGELQQAWRREHNFASDVSHELRTPIALIRNTLALNEQGPLSSADRELLNQSTETLQNTVEVLLALARKENLVFERHVFLPLLERTILALHHSHPAPRFDVELNIRDDFQVWGNPNLLGLLCQNLINNGFYHGGNAGMKVYLREQFLIFENHIPDTPPDNNYQGLGHGQYLVSRIAQVMGWNINIVHDNALYQVTLEPPNIQVPLSEK